MGQCKLSLLPHLLWDGFMCLISALCSASGEAAVVGLVAGLAGLLPSAWLGSSIILRRMEIRDERTTVLK